MKLTDLKNVTKLNEKAINFVVGGTVPVSSLEDSESKKQDVSSTSNDSLKHD